MCGCRWWEGGEECVGVGSGKEEKEQCVGVGSGEVVKNVM